MTEQEAIDRIVTATDAFSDPALTAEEVEDLLAQHLRGAVWQPATAYEWGQRLFPTVANGHWYEVAANGVSGTMEPVWPRGSGYPQTFPTIRNGTLWLRDLGPAPSGLWDVEAAISAAWSLKAAKAANRVTSKEGDVAYSEDQVYKHCIEMARLTAPVGFA